MVIRNISIQFFSLLLHGKLLGINSARTPINFLVTVCFKGKQGPLEFPPPPLPSCCFVATLPLQFCQLGYFTHSYCSWWVMQHRLLWIWENSSRCVSYCVVFLSPKYSKTQRTTWYSEHIFRCLKFRKKVQSWMDFILEQVLDFKWEGFLHWFAFFKSNNMQLSFLFF